MPDSQDDRARTRELALAHAVNVAANQQVNSFNGHIVVNVAKAFEAYLNGEELPAEE